MGCFSSSRSRRSRPWVEEALRGLRRPRQAWPALSPVVQTQDYPLLSRGNERREPMRRPAELEILTILAVTPTGLDAVRRSQEDLRRMARGLDPELETP